MLNNSKSYANVILIGSTSEIGQEVLKNINLNQNSKIIFVGRSKPELMKNLSKGYKVSFYNADLGNLKSVQKLTRKIEKIQRIDLLILAVGYLPPENSEFNKESIIKSLTINSLSSTYLLSVIANKMLTSEAGDILVISSVAMCRARSRNFTYGSSKAQLDFYATGLARKLKKRGVSILILRPGFVFSKMTKNFRPAPFPTDPQSVGKIAAEGLVKSKKIIYAPKILKYVMILIKILPNKIINLI